MPLVASIQTSSSRLGRALSWKAQVLVPASAEMAGVEVKEEEERLEKVLSAETALAMARF